MKMRTLLAAAAVLAAGLSLHAPAKAADIVDTAVEAGSFTTLVKAVQAAGLVETLKGDGPFTVFAPTDEAFKGVGADTLESLLRPENRQKLVEILSYHVVPGKVTAADALGSQTYLKTAAGPALYVTGVSGTVMVANDDYLNSTAYADVIQADIMTDNGVIHVIDKVLMPPRM